MSALASQAYHNSSRVFQEFRASIPENTLNATCKSALYSFTVTTMLYSNPSIGCTYAAVAALAALVDSAITPFFSSVCSSKESPDKIRWYESIAKRFVTLSLVQAATGFKVSSLWAITNLFFVNVDRDGNAPNDVVPSYLIFPCRQ